MSFFELTYKWTYLHNLRASTMLKGKSAYVWLNEPGFRMFSSWRVKR